MGNSTQEPLTNPSLSTDEIGVSKEKKHGYIVILVTFLLLVVTGAFWFGMHFLGKKQQKKL